MVTIDYYVPIFHAPPNVRYVSGSVIMLDLGYLDLIALIVKPTEKVR